MLSLLHKEMITNSIWDASPFSGQHCIPSIPYELSLYTLPLLFRRMNEIFECAVGIAKRLYAWRLYSSVSNCSIWKSQGGVSLESRRGYRISSLTISWGAPLSDVLPLSMTFNKFSLFLILFFLKLITIFEECVHSNTCMVNCTCTNNGSGENT